MKKLIGALLLIAAPAQATGNLMIENFDIHRSPILVVLEGLGRPNKCTHVIPTRRTRIHYPAYRRYPASFDTHYQNINGWVKLYRMEQFGSTVREAVKNCNFDHTKQKPIYKKYVEFASPHSTDNIIITWPDDALKKKGALS